MAAEDELLAVAVGGELSPSKSNVLLLLLLLLFPFDVVAVAGEVISS